MSIGNNQQVQDELIYTTGFLPVVKEKRQIVKPEGKITRREYDLAVVLEDGRELDTYTFSSIQKIEYSEHWDECCDAELNPKDKKALKAYLQRQIAGMEWKKRIFIDRLGLIAGDKMRYVYAKNAVISDSKEDSYIFTDDLPEFQGENEVDVTDMLKYAESVFFLKPGVTDVLFSARLLCIIKPILLMLKYPADFFLVLYGESGALKSTYAKLFFVDNREQMMNFTMDKSRQVLERIEKYRGHAVVVDDYHPAAKDYDRKRQDSIMDIIARNADSGCGALAVATGEFLRGSFSLQDRMVQIRVPKMSSEGAVDETSEFLKKLSGIQRNSYMLQTVLYEFARRVYSDIEGIQKILSGIIQSKGINGISCRIERNVHILYMAMTVFNHVFPEYNFESWDKTISGSLRSLEDTQSKHMEIVKRLEGYPDWTDEVFRMLDTSLIEREYEFSKKLSKRAEVIINKGQIFITPLALETEMQKHLQMYVDVDKIVNHLVKTQVLDEDNSAAHTKKKGNTRYYVINRDRLELYHTKRYPDTSHMKASNEEHNPNLVIQTMLPER